MLKKQQISKIKIYSEEWHQFRLGKLTSSRWHSQMGLKPLTDGALTYLYNKVGELLTGQTAAEEGEIETEYTAWGLKNEPYALELFAKIKQVEFITNQNIVFSLDGRFSSTPDAIWIHNQSIDGNEYNVSTLEAKCPPTYANYIKLFKCKTPQHLKGYSLKYYWQTIDQMYLCDSAVGYFMCYHPMFPAASNHNIIQFNKIDLWDDFKLMAQRKKIAFDKFNEIKNEMTNERSV